MKKLILLVVLLSAVFTLAQETPTEESQVPTEEPEVRREEPREKKGRWVVGGGLGLGFSNGFYIQLSPEVGYRINNFEIGGIVGFSYFDVEGSNAFNFSSEDYTSTQWSFGPYIVYSPIPSLYLRGEYQYYTGNIDFENQLFADDSYDESALWLGGGYQNRLSPHVYYRIGLMYNVLFDEDESIFSSGFVPSIGISAGL